jgi:hypothetical protein
MIYGTTEFEELLIKLIKNKLRHDIYEESVKCCEEMAVHIYGDKPDAILSRVRPREPDEVKAYRLENYEPTTKATASKALSIVSKIFNPWLSEIKWKEQNVNGKKLEDYALQNYPEFNSIIKFMAEAGLKRMISDANGVIGIRPLVAPENQLQQTEPIICLYGSKSIWWRDNESVIIFQRAEETKEGVVNYFTYYDKVQVIDFSAQVISADTITTTEIFVYPHGFNELPIWTLQGESQTTDEGLTYYVSFFDPAKPFWNKAIIHESDLDAAYISHLFPQKVELVSECDFVFENQRCEMGKITNQDGKVKTCPGCQGTGFKRSVGPYGVHQVSSDKLTGLSTAGYNPVSYVTVDTKPTEMLEARVEKMHIKGLEALNMDVVDKVGENQSGIAKVIDRGELYDFLYKIASVVYATHLTNIFYFFNRYMNGIVDSNPTRNLESNLPEINTPTKFDISSTAEMTLDYKTAKDADVNPEYLRQKQIAIVSKEFANQPDLKKRIIATIELDPLPGVTVEEADSLLATQVVSKRDLILHFQMGKFITQAALKDGDFFNRTMDEKIATLGKLADQFIIDNKIVLDTSAIEPQLVVA